MPSEGGLTVIMSPVAVLDDVSKKAQTQSCHVRIPQYIYNSSHVDCLFFAGLLCDFLFLPE